MQMNANPQANALMNNIMLTANNPVKNANRRLSETGKYEQRTYVQDHSPSSSKKEQNKTKSYITWRWKIIHTPTPSPFPQQYNGSIPP